MQNHYFDDIYEVVKQIPPGRVTTYGAIADYLALGSARMVGWALKNLGEGAENIPAHRVVNAKGELSGRHMFKPPERMGYLLKKEGVLVNNEKVLRFKDCFWHPESLV